MYAERHTVIVTTVTATGENFTPEIPYGRVHSIRYVKAGSGGYSNGVDFVITGETTGTPILTAANVNASATFFPKAAANKVADGTASTISEADVVIVGERIKIAVAEGGNGTVGTFYITLC